MFDPESDGPHSHTCLNVTGAKPVDLVDYPVKVRASSPVTLDSVAVTYADGVQVVGSWVSPGTETGAVGILPGWPADAIVTQDSTLNWSKRVPAAGATLDPSTWYNVFLHLRVYPDALPLHTSGVVFTFHDASGSHTVTWVDHLVFKQKC
jgi:hypothetical protein